jgi:hypothetical protein
MGDRVNVNPQEISRAGVTPTYNAASADNNSFVNDGRTLVQVLNVGAEMTVTIVTPGTVDGLAITDRAVVVPLTTGNKMIGPFPPDIYNQSDGKVHLNWSRSSDVTFAVMRMS